MNFIAISWNSYQDSNIKNLGYLLTKARYFVAPKTKPEGKVAHRLYLKQYYIRQLVEKSFVLAPK